MFGYICALCQTEKKGGPSSPASRPPSGRSETFQRPILRTAGVRDADAVQRRRRRGGRWPKHGDASCTQPNVLPGGSLALTLVLRILASLSLSLLSSADIARKHRIGPRNKASRPTPRCTPLGHAGARADGLPAYLLGLLSPHNVLTWNVRLCRVNMVSCAPLFAQSWEKPLLFRWWPQICRQSRGVWMSPRGLFMRYLLKGSMSAANSRKSRAFRRAC